MKHFGRARQSEIYVNGVAGRQPRVPVDATRLERAAKRAMSTEAFAYVAGGAGCERTMRANREAFARWRIVPRVLRDVSTHSMATTLFGRALATPLLLSPVGVLEMAHADADLAVARAAAAAQVPFIFSSQASVPMERCAAAMGDAPRWFQLYWNTVDAVAESFVHRAEGCGADAIVLTLDTTVLGWRPRDLDLGYLPFLEGRGIAQYTSDPVFMQSLATPLDGAAPAAKAPVRPRSIAALVHMARLHPGSTLGALRSGVARAAVQRFIATYSRTTLTWSDIKRLRSMTRLPIVLKGVLHPDDARRAVDEGVAGVFVSNHGGRQIDGEIASLDALPGIVDAVRGAIPVLFDSGIRSGADAFVALALGATAVSIGRPYVYGLALAGEAGVLEVIHNVLAELDLTMALAGCQSVADITRDMVARG